MKKCTPDEFEAALLDSLSEYTTEVTKEIKNNVDIVAKETNEEIKNQLNTNIEFKGKGDYIKAFRLITAYDGLYDKRVVWCVKSPHYRLTHLLENGHAKKGGGRTRAFPHIKYGQELAEKRMEELAEEAVQNAGN